MSLFSVDASELIHSLLSPSMHDHCNILLHIVRAIIGFSCSAFTLHFTQARPLLVHQLSATTRVREPASRVSITCKHNMQTNSPQPSPYNTHTPPSRTRSRRANGKDAPYSGVYNTPYLIPAQLGLLSSLMFDIRSTRLDVLPLKLFNDIAYACKECSARIL